MRRSPNASIRITSIGGEPVPPEWEGPAMRAVAMSEASPDYPLGGSVEPYDIAVEMELTDERYGSR